MGSRANLVGQTFGRLLVESDAGNRSYDSLWNCLCACGTRKPVTGRCLTSGHTKSCGCYHRETAARAALKHGKCYTNEWVLWYNARRRAKAKSVPFSLALEDVVIPTRCPLLDIPILRGVRETLQGSPTLDRKIPALGYTRENAWVISHRANTIKNSASAAELELIATNLRKALQ